MVEPLVHFDMYTPDMYLFAEPLADELGEAWNDGLRCVLTDLDRIVQPGGAITWGRSSGLLAMALTVELAAVGLRHDLVERPSPWLHRARLEADRLLDLFPDGVVAAHQGRATMNYRGPERRLQMTFDLLDKLAAAAVDLAVAEPAEPGDRVGTWPEVDERVQFDDETAAGVWTHRSSGPVSLVLPLLRGWAPVYAPSPRRPGLFEVPTEGHPSLLPVVMRGEDRLLPAGLPQTVTHGPGELEVAHQAWATVGGGPEDELATPGHRRAVFRTDGRELRVTEEIEVADPALAEDDRLSARARRPAPDRHDGRQRIRCHRPPHRHVGDRRVAELLGRAPARPPDRGAAGRRASRVRLDGAAAPAHRQHDPRPLVRRRPLRPDRRPGRPVPAAAARPRPLRRADGGRRVPSSAGPSGTRASTRRGRPR